MAARRRIAELETELAIHRRATELLREAVPPKGRYAAVQTMAAVGTVTRAGGHVGWGRPAPVRTAPSGARA